MEKVFTATIKLARGVPYHGDCYEVKTEKEVDHFETPTQVRAILASHFGEILEKNLRDDVAMKITMQIREI